MRKILIPLVVAALAVGALYLPASHTDHAAPTPTMHVEEQLVDDPAVEPTNTPVTSAPVERVVPLCSLWADDADPVLPEGAYTDRCISDDGLTISYADGHTEPAK